MDKAHFSIYIHVTLLMLAFSFLTCTSDNHHQMEEYIKNGQSLYDSGSYKDAIISWKKAKMLSPKNRDLNFSLANAYQLLGQFDLSIEVLNQIIDENIEDFKANFMLAQNQLFLGNYKAATATCDKLEAIFPNNFKVTILRGDIAILMGLYEDGEAFYQHAIDKGNQNSEAYFKLAFLFLVQNKSTIAEQIFQKAINFNEKESVQYWLHIAAYQSLKDNSDESIAAINSALKIQPQSNFLFLKLTQLLIAYKRYDVLIDFLTEFSAISNDNQLIRKLYVEVLLNSNEIEKANSILQDYELSKDPEWLLLLGKNSLLQGFFPLASSYFEQVLVTHQNDPNAHYMLALAYLAADRINLATRSLIRLLTIYPEMVEAELALAAIYYKKDEHDLSIDYLNRVIHKIPEHPRPYIMLGNCMLSTGQYDKAISNFEKALLLAPKSITGLYYLAIAKEKVGLSKEAIQLYRSILTESPDKVDVGQRLAGLLIQQGRTDEAINFFRSIVLNHPENGYHKLILGNIYCTLHEYDKAGYYYRLAVEASPYLLEAYKKLADLQPDSMEKIYIIKDALRIVPGSIDLMIFLAGIYFSENQLDSAISVVNEAYLANPQNPLLANNLSWLYLEKETKLNDAYELALSAFEKDQQNPSFAHTLGLSLYKKGFFQKAEWQFRESLRLIENKKQVKSNKELRAIVSYHLALTLLKRGHKAEAKDRLDSALEFGLPSRYNKHAREILETIQNSGDRASEQAGTVTGPTF